MRNLKNYDEFMDFCGDALEPIVTICADKEAAAAFREKKILKAAAVVCKKYKEETAAVLAALDGCTIEEFKATFSPKDVPAKLTELLNSPEFKDLFGSAQNKNEASSSGTAQEATPA
jgi:hypothetical protein